MKTPALLAIVLLLGISVALAATNPTTPGYGMFLERSLGDALLQLDQSQPDQNRFIRDVLKQQGRQVIDSAILTKTVRRNYGLFSLFETQAFGVRVVMLGIGGNFFPVEGEKEIALLLGRASL
jgi:hypothetical protein